MMMQMVGGFAEFERAMIRERTSAGLAAARAEGRVGGRRTKLDPVKRRKIAESVIADRKSAADMARLYNISQPTVSRIIAQHRLSSPPACSDEGDVLWILKKFGEYGRSRFIRSCSE
jgi:DNA invertase Pin-like site-specific DNA recombinase